MRPILTGTILIVFTSLSQHCSASDQSERTAKCGKNLGDEVKMAKITDNYSADENEVRRFFDEWAGLHSRSTGRTLHRFGNLELWGYGDDSHLPNYVTITGPTPRPIREVDLKALTAFVGTSKGKVYLTFNEFAAEDGIDILERHGFRRVQSCAGVYRRLDRSFAEPNLTLEQNPVGDTLLTEYTKIFAQSFPHLASLAKELNAFDFGSKRREFTANAFLYRRKGKNDWVGISAFKSYPEFPRIAYGCTLGVIASERGQGIGREIILQRYEAMRNAGKFLFASLAYRNSSLPILESTSARPIFSDAIFEYSPGHEE